MEYTFTKEDIEKVEKFIDIKNRGYYCDGSQLTAVYNRVLHKNVNTTNCGSCIRARIQELENALNAFKRLSENVSTDEPSVKTNGNEDTPVKEEENKATGDVKNEPTEKKRVGRPRKN